MDLGWLRRNRRLLIFIALSAPPGMAFSAGRGNGLAIGGAVGVVIAIGAVAIENVVARTRVGDALRRLPLLAESLTVTAAYLCVILPALLIAFGRLDAVAIVYSVAVTVLFTAASRLGRLIGWRVIGSVMVGRYRRPVREDRIFLFLDLAGSTGLAERLGETRVQELIGRFYFDIARPIAAHGGEIYQYRGDEISVTWPLRAGLRDANCVACAFAIRSVVAARADWYRRSFGVVPTFRIGLHGGPVVAGEVGDQRREILFFGDTINVAARIEALCKRELQDVCISGDLLRRLELPAPIRATALGAFRLQGKQQDTEVYALSAA